MVDGPEDVDPPIQLLGRSQVDTHQRQHVPDNRLQLLVLFFRWSGHLDVDVSQPGVKKGLQFFRALLRRPQAWHTWRRGSRVSRPYAEWDALRFVLSERK